ncbi:dentin sialophosphoprotein-like [Stylophora pistillata]|uniref:dentin sialophosphoprotein-like n=1 Tax=Stylophora pistillata TaxID=50429 RepID=UPI000C04E262|nr:dentin sialophosphoprotein-like [Stylophora pistillata]
MAEDKVVQSKEELGLESKSSTDIEKCQVLFKKESDVTGHKSTEEQVEDTEGNQDSRDNSSFAADISEATLSDKGGDFKASSSVANSEKTEVSPASGKLEDLEIGSSTDTLKGKDSANQGKVNFDDELSSGQFGLKEESDNGDGKSTVGHQASPVEAEGSLDFADNISSGRLQDKVTAIQEKMDLDDGFSSDHFASKESVDDGSKPKVFQDYSTSKKESNDDGSKPKGAANSEATLSDKGVDFKASSSVAESEKTKVSSASGKIEDLEISSYTGKDSANQEKVDLDGGLSSSQLGFKNVSDDRDGKSTVGHQASPAAVEGNVDFADNSSPGTVQDKVTAIKKKLDLDDGLSSDHFASKKESDDDGSKPKDYFTSKKESNDDGSKPKGDKEINMAADGNLAVAEVDNSSPVIKEAQVEAAEGNEDFAVNNSSIEKLIVDQLLACAIDTNSMGKSLICSKTGSLHRFNQTDTLLV